MTHMTLLTGPERRRRWNEDGRARILSASFAPGAVVADVARQFEISTSLIYKWRKACLAPAAAPAFAPAILVDAPEATPDSRYGWMTNGGQVITAATTVAPAITARRVLNDIRSTDRRRV